MMSTRFALGLLLGLLVVGAVWIGVGERGGFGLFGASDSVDAFSQPARIFVDGRMTEWDSLRVHRNDLGDGERNGIDRLWTAHSQRHLFFRIELARALNLQEDNALTLAVDTDHDSTTGRDTLGLGAELTWTFGERTGRVGGKGIEHAEIGITSLPTVRSSTFEIALDRTAAPHDSVGLFPADTVRIVLANEEDRLPDGETSLTYAIDGGPGPVNGPTIGTSDPSSVRLLSYNAVNDFERELNSLFKSERQPAYRRILGAVAPDVIGFQEVYDQSAAETEQVAESALGISDDWNWAKEGQDLVLGTRYPILGTHAIPGYEEYESAAFLLDARSQLGDSLLVVVAHPPCCNTPAEDGEPSSNTKRQHVVDGIAAFLRKAHSGEGPFSVASGTPITVLGDMNFVGDPGQPRTLKTGNIVHEDRFGPSTAPDWDGTPLLDTRPRQTFTPMHTTWEDAESSFPPGRLDYVYISDSVLKVAHEFVLSTTDLPESVLREEGLRSSDTRIASDHLPVVVDVRARTPAMDR